MPATGRRTGPFWAGMLLGVPGAKRPRPGLRQIAIAGAIAIVAAGHAAQAAPQASLDLSQYRGKVVYLDFWASWCAPCKLSFPFLQKLQAYYAGRNFVLLAVNVDHDRAKADAFLREAGGNLPVVYDATGAIARTFNVKAMPTSVVIGPDGRVRYVHSGFFPDQMPLYEAHITELLNAK
jgi:thiol-disulfide isomerase/thioredoxin